MIDSMRLHSRETLNLIIQRTIEVYRWAVYVSFAFLGAGFLIAVFTDKAVDSNMGGPVELWRHMRELHPSGFFGVGIGVMILSPIVMLIFAASTFFRAGDRKFGYITSTVAFILSISILISFLKG